MNNSSPSGSSFSAASGVQDRAEFPLLAETRLARYSCRRNTFPPNHATHTSRMESQIISASRAPLRKCLPLSHNSEKYRQRMDSQIFAKTQPRSQSQGTRNRRVPAEIILTGPDDSFHDRIAPSSFDQIGPCIVFRVELGLGDIPMSNTRVHIGCHWVLEQISPASTCPSVKQ